MLGGEECCSAINRLREVDFVNGQELVTLSNATLGMSGYKALAL